MVYETWGEGKGCPPSATTDYVVRDRGNATPRAMRPTLHLVPSGSDLLKQSGLPLAVIIQPLAAPQPGDTPLQVMLPFKTLPPASLFPPHTATPSIAKCAL